MPASLHLGIRDAVAALYSAAPALAAGRVLENRELPLPAGVESQIQVFRIFSSPERWAIQNGPIDWSTQIRTVIKARKGANDSAEIIADAIAVECFARAMADQSLGGRAEDLQPGPFNWDQDEADANVVAVTWDVIYLHRTSQQSIS